MAAAAFNLECRSKSRRSQPEATDQINHILALSNELTAVGLAIIDAQFQYVEVNQYLADLNGLSRDAHVNRSVCSVVPEVGPMLTQLVQRTLQTKLSITSAKFAARVPFVSGPLRDWLGSFFPVRFGNSAVGVAHTVFEITEYSRIDAILADLALIAAEPQHRESLTSREIDVLALIGQGKTTKEIADLLSISTQTVGNHRKHICRKLNIHTTAELVSFACGRYGMLTDSQQPILHRPELPHGRFTLTAL